MLMVNYGFQNKTCVVSLNVYHQRMESKSSCGPSRDLFVCVILSVCEIPFIIVKLS